MPLGVMPNSSCGPCSSRSLANQRERAATAPDPPQLIGGLGSYLPRLEVSPCLFGAPDDFGLVEWDGKTGIEGASNIKQRVEVCAATTTQLAA